MIEQLQATHNLLQLVVDDIAHVRALSLSLIHSTHSYALSSLQYKQLAIAALQVMSNKASGGEELNNARLLPGADHRSNVTLRLNFIKFLLDNSMALVLTPEQTDQIWDAMVDKAITQGERDYCFLWLKRLCSSAQWVVQHVFQRKLCSLDFSGLTLLGFKCFESAFRSTNAMANRLDRAYDKRRFEVLDYQLIGLDSLWQLVLDVQDPEVSSVAIEYLTNLYDRVRTLAVTLKYIASNTNQAFVAVSLSRLSRCLQ